jgi:flagellar basal-body rod modification protein FlgD
MSTINSSIFSTPSTGTSSVGSNTLQSTNSTLSPSDFISLLVTQLQNQDPTQPMDNTTLLTQLSQIGQLESSDSLQTTLQGITLQSSIGSAGNMIGKSVQGLDDNGNSVSGIVTSIQVQNQSVYLSLDSGASLQLGNVEQIAPGNSTTGTTTTTAATNAMLPGVQTAAANPTGTAISNIFNSGMSLAGLA